MAEIDIVENFIQRTKNMSDKELATLVKDMSLDEKSNLMHQTVKKEHFELINLHEQDFNEYFVKLGKIFAKETACIIFFIKNDSERARQINSLLVTLKLTILAEMKYLDSTFIK